MIYLRRSVSIVYVSYSRILAQSVSLLSKHGSELTPVNESGYDKAKYEFLAIHQYRRT